MSREYGQRLYESIIENARSKVVFSLSLRERNLAPLADWLYSGTFDPNRIKLELYSRKVMDYAEETREITSRATSRGMGRSEARGEAVGTGSVQGESWGASGEGAIILPPTQWSHSTAESRASTDTSSRGQSESESESESVSEVPVFIPIFGEERSSVQYSPLEEQRFQADRLEQLAKLPYVLSCDEALARLEKRQSALVLPSIAPETEPKSYKRRVRASAKSSKTGGESQG